jgi:hypothetical protein
MNYAPLFGRGGSDMYQEIIDLRDKLLEEAAKGRDPRTGAHNDLNRLGQLLKAAYALDDLLYPADRINCRE